MEGCAEEEGKEETHRLAVGPVARDTLVDKSAQTQHGRMKIHEHAVYPLETA